MPYNAITQYINFISLDEFLCYVVAQSDQSDISPIKYHQVVF